MRNLVFASLFLFACGGGSSGSKPSTTQDLAMVVTVQPDLSSQQSEPDMTQVTGDAGGGTGTQTCGDIFSCTANATTQAEVDACVAAGSTAGQAQYNALNNCLTTECGSLPATGGTGSCGNQTTCSYCTQSGTSSDNMTNGTCSNLAAGGGPTITDPTCGTCVDQLLGCMS